MITKEDKVEHDDTLVMLKFALNEYDTPSMDTQIFDKKQSEGRRVDGTLKRGSKYHN